MSRPYAADARGRLFSRFGQGHHIRRWLNDVEAEERAAQIQIRRLEADLKEILPTLGYDFDHEDLREANVVALPKPGK